MVPLRGRSRLETCNYYIVNVPLTKLLNKLENEALLSESKTLGTV
jgi:hypothetical protein